MKTINIPFLILLSFYLSSQVIYPQTDSLKPDYRNHINILEYNKTLMPLQKVSAGSGTWTELNPKVPRVDYIGVFFINKDTGWACGANGTVIKTINGGEGWSVSETNIALPILKVKSFNGQIVIAAGYDGLILRSTNGGETFAQIASGVSGDLWGLEIVNDTLGWICGATTLLKTTDAGESWQIVNTPGYTGNLWAVEFLNDSYGFLAADGKVLRTANGGVDWEIIQAGDNQSLYIVDIIDSLHIVAAGYGGTSYRGKNIYSSDGGLTWITGGPLTFEPVNDIKYVNRDTGYVVMNNTIGFKTTNRGQQWTGITIGGEWEMQFLKEENIGYSVGTGLRIYKTENSFENWQRLIINDNFSDVFFINEDVGFAISGVLSLAQGLYKTTDGGINWDGVPGPSGEDIFFLDSLTGFIAGTPCRIWKTTNSGNSWYITNITGLADTLGTIKKVLFINQTIGWAVTSRGGILKTTDSGENWFTQLNSGISVIFSSVSFIDSLTGWTANSNSRPFKTTNSGDNWLLQNNIDIWQSIDVLFLNSIVGFLLESNKFYKTTNGGTSWLLDPIITGFSVAGKFSYYPDSTIFITGYKTFRSLDAGISWIYYPELTGTRISGLSLLGKGYGFAVGDLGFILKYNDDSVPVELTKFIGTIAGKTIRLEWNTSTETNNLGFEIERKRINDTWEKIDFVGGKGTTTQPQSYYYFDENLVAGKYLYRLKQIDFDGTFEYSNVIEIQLNSPSAFLLSQNYPNPFNPETNIDYRIPEETLVNITLYDITGRKINELVNEKKQPGYYTLKLKGGALSSGIYFYRLLTSNGYNNVKKLTILK
ncbi:MAG: YCF48-related protein [Ignavibacteriaceae bacterium]